MKNIIRETNEFYMIKDESMLEVEIENKGKSCICAFLIDDIAKKIDLADDEYNHLNVLNAEDVIVTIIYNIWDDEDLFFDSSSNDVVLGTIGDIKWHDERNPSDILKYMMIKRKCEKIFSDGLQVEDIHIYNMYHQFAIEIKNAFIKFDKNNFDNIYSGEFYGHYRLIKNREKLVSDIKDIIKSNRTTIDEFMQCSIDF